MSRFRRSFVVIALAAASCTTPSTPPVPLTSVSIDAGYGYGCAVTDTGDLYCWGTNNEGQTGDSGNLQTDIPPAPQALRVQNLPPVTQVSTALSHSCAVSESLDIYCWGFNADGALGRPDVLMETELFRPEKVEGLPQMVRVETMQYGACGIDVAGDVYCWGYHTYLEGFFGGIARTDGATPYKNPSVSNVVDIDGELHGMCAVESDGDLWCWGTAPGASANLGVPAQIPGVTDAASVAVGRAHACFLSTAGEVSCFGDNRWGQLGSAVAPGPPTPVTQPLPVAGLAGLDIDSVEVGGSTTCVSTTSGDVYCFGYNLMGQHQLPYSNFGAYPEPRLAPALTDVEDLSVSGSMTCVISQSAGPTCWGDNHTGGLGHSINLGRYIQDQLIGTVPVVAPVIGL